MSATVSDILGKGYAFEQTAELQKLPAATGTILAGIGAANWGPIGLPTFLQTGLPGFEKIFGSVIDSTEAKDSSYLMMAYHFLSSSRGWYTRVAEGAVKSTLDWHIPDAAPQLLGNKIVKNKDFLLYDSTDGAKENNKMTFRVEVDDAGTPTPIDIDVLLDPSKKALLVSESQDQAGGVIKSSYQKNTILKIQDGNDVITNEYGYTVVASDEFTKLKADVEAETYANFSIAWIRAALKYFVKTTDSSAIPASIFKFKEFRNRANDGKIHGPLKLVATKALTKEAKGEITYRVTEIADKAFNLASAAGADISTLNGKYILLAPDTYTQAASFTGGGLQLSVVNLVTTGTDAQLYHVSITGSTITLSPVTLSAETAFVLKDDVASGISTLADDSFFTLDGAGVVAGANIVALNAGEKFLVEGFTVQKRDIVHYTGASTYVPYANSPKLIVNALYVDHYTGGSDNLLLKYNGSAIVSVNPGTNKYYIKKEGSVFSVATTWVAGTATLSNADKIIDDDAGTLLSWNSGDSAFELVADYQTLNPFVDNTGIAASAFTGVSSTTLPTASYYKYKTSTGKFASIAVVASEYGVAATGYDTVGGFATAGDVYQYNGTAFISAVVPSAEGDVWISANLGLLLYKTATGWEVRYNNLDTTSANVIAFESSDRGSKAFVRVMESVANVFKLGDVSKAYGLNTPIATIIANINYQTSREYQTYLTNNSLPPNMSPNSIPTELDRLLVATVSDADTLLITTVQSGSNIKIVLNSTSGVGSWGNISNINAYTVLGLPQVGNVTLYPSGSFTVSGKDQELVGNFEAFYTGKDGNTIRFVNSLSQDGTTLKVYFRNTLQAVFTNYSYNPADANYIGTLLEQDVNTRELVVMTSLVPNKTFPYGSFQFSGGSSGGMPGDEVYASEVVKYKNIDLYDIDLLCVSGLSSETVLSKVKEVCEYREDCLGIIDPPQLLSVNGVLNWANGFGDGNPDTTDDSAKLNSAYTATYYPWIKIPIVKNGTTIYQWQPPSVRVAGSIAKNDNAQGHKVGAPAGVRTVFTDVTALEVYLEEEDKTRLYADVYDANINPIVFTTADGYFIDGQKTTWRRKDALRRINVARAGMYIKKRVQEAAKLFFWNPTDPAAWADYGVLLKNVLRQLVAWRAAGEDYVVTTDASVNTPEITNQNGMVGVIDWTPTKVTERLKTISNIKEGATAVVTQVV